MRYSCWLFDSVKYAALRVTTTSLMKLGAAVVELVLLDQRPVVGVVDERLAGTPAGDEEPVVPPVVLDADRRADAIELPPRSWSRETVRGPTAGGSLPA